MERQAEVYEMARRVDILLVVGGKNSANTGKLAEIGLRWFQLIISKGLKNLNPAGFMGKTIGVTAGASTPQEQIDEVVNWLEENLQEA